MLWVSDFTYVSTWQGFAYVGFVIDTFANRVRHWSRTNGDQRLTRLESITVSPGPTAFWMRVNKPFTRDDRFNNCRLLETVGNIPPTEAGEACLMQT